MNPAKPDPIPFTAAGFAKLQAEQTELIRFRSEVLVRLQAAREMGDLSENGAYHAAKFELGRTDRRLRELAYLLRYGQVTLPQNSTQVGFGHQVTLKNGNGEVVYTLVSKYESNPAEHRLSIDSPVGQALLGKKVGDEVVIHAPAGPQTYRLISIA